MKLVSIYLDNAATTPLCEAAKNIILDNLDEFWNINSVYQPARELNLKVEQAREKIAELIGAQSADEIYFTSGGCEANSWVRHNWYDGDTSNIEHSSNKFYSATEMHVDSNGIVDTDQIYKWISKRPCPSDILSVMYVNNELGTIQPIKRLSEIAHLCSIPFHTDAVQALPHISINVQELGIDMMSASAHKFNGPKGVGFLYVGNGSEIDLDPFIYGGAQERGKRGGTTNAVGILAMAAALEDTVKNMDEINSRIAHLSNKLRDNLLDIKGVGLNVDPTKIPCIDGILNLRIDDVRGSDMVTMADQFGICISAGSACHEGDANPSHVLKAIGLTDEQAFSSIRISIGRYNTEEEIDMVCRLFPKIIERLRTIRKD